MKRFLCVLFICLLFLTACGQKPVSNTEELLNMSDSELIEWLKGQGVEIPKDYDDELLWADFAHTVVEATIADENFSGGIGISYYVTADFGDAITEAVRNYIE